MLLKNKFDLIWFEQDDKMRVKRRKENDASESRSK